MSRARTKRWLGRSLAAPLAILAAVTLASSALAVATSFQVVSTDPYTNTNAYHATEVEPDSFSSGNTVVSTFQSGRFQDGGASNLGWATSLDGGTRWKHGFLRNTTIYATPPGIFQRVTDPSVAYDASHGQWMIGILASKSSSGFIGGAILVARSSDGTHWGAPVVVQKGQSFNSYDSTWLACDNTATSPNYGHCYFSWDDFGQGALLEISTSTDGGLTWTPASVPSAGVIGSKPVSQPNGTVVVVADSNPISQAESFISHDGGVSFTGPFKISVLSYHTPDGGLRGLDIVSDDVDASGKLYAVWYDCRFRTGCPSNDIVMSTSTDGNHWTAAVRIPIDDVTSPLDHFLPGIAAQPGTSGSSAQLAVVYNYFSATGCSTSTCQLYFGVIRSSDGGSTWATAITLGGPMQLKSLPLTSSGYMVTDYNSASFTTAGLTTVFPVARTGTTCTLGTLGSCQESMVAPTAPLAGPAGPTHRVDTRPAHGWRPTVPGALVSAR